MVFSSRHWKPNQDNGLKETLSLSESHTCSVLYMTASWSKLESQQANGDKIPRTRKSRWKGTYRHWQLSLVALGEWVQWEQEGRYHSNELAAAGVGWRDAVAYRSVKTLGRVRTCEFLMKNQETRWLVLSLCGLRPRLHLSHSKTISVGLKAKVVVQRCENGRMGERKAEAQQWGPPRTLGGEIFQPHRSSNIKTHSRYSGLSQDLPFIFYPA